MELDWKNLGFQYIPTQAFVQADYADGKWGGLQIRTEPYLPLHIAASCMHYGQACFEGLKAFRAPDGRVAMFRPGQNARRLRNSAERVCMEAPSDALFVEACELAIRENLSFVPPYGTGASLYLRPLLVGTEATIGIKPSDSYTFIVLVTPVGPYYKDGFSPVNAVVIDEYDRAAPRGTGQAKVAGNYAASLKPQIIAKKMGYPIVLFSDATEHRFVDEFGTSNFIGITPAGEFKTPDSSSILPSVTNDSLQIMARDMGLRVVKEPIALDSLDQFSEVGACGTAAVITPVHSVTWGERTFTFGKVGEAGPTLTRLYKGLQALQYGEAADPYGWMIPVS